jgi:A/G-specific adenine glycosylase
MVSEVMLQQTQAARVAEMFRTFLLRFPTIDALAAASRAEVLRAWNGLGYNRRAVALSKAARIIVRDHGGRVPSDSNALTHLPGVGPYTAAAVASLAFGAPVPAIDTNVARVVARAILGKEPHATRRADVRRAAERWLARSDPAAWNQALMDLGRDICRPRPRCPECPLFIGCRFRRTGELPKPGSRRPEPFEGSFRQVRGAVVKALRDRRSMSLSGLARAVGRPVPRVVEAVTALASDGLVDAGPAALGGSPRGRVRLPS